MKNIKNIILGVIFTFSAASLSAATISVGSQIGFGGFSVTLLDVDAVGGTIALRDVSETDVGGSPLYTATTSFIDAEAIRFEHSNFGGTHEADVNNATGDFLSLALLEPDPSGLEANYADFAFKPGLLPNPVNPLWSVALSANDDLAFSMNSIQVTAHTAGGLALTGQGTISGGGFDDTEGEWNFSTQTNSFTWSASTTAVPEPSTYALFGMAFVGLGIVGYRKRRA